jgi:uncharacterized membrane protein YedE/YeeE
MMKLFISFLTGFMFSAGLAIAGMVDPNKVIGFLDVTGSWDPALAFVMGGGVGLNFVLFKFILKRENPLLSESFPTFAKSEVDKRLILGSILFGVGWGIGGICPGPGIANLFTGQQEMFAFVGAMIVGMLIFKVVNPFLIKKGL